MTRLCCLNSEHAPRSLPEIHLRFIPTALRRWAGPRGGDGAGLAPEGPLSPASPIRAERRGLRRSLGRRALSFSLCWLDPRGGGGGGRRAGGGGGGGGGCHFFLSFAGTGTFFSSGASGCN